MQPSHTFMPRRGAHRSLSRSDPISHDSMALGQRSSMFSCNRNGCFQAGAGAQQAGNSLRCCAPSTRALGGAATAHKAPAASPPCINLGSGFRSPLPSRCVAAPAASASPGSQPVAENSRGGRMTYRPSSYAEMVEDAVGSITSAAADGDVRMEVEFPPVPVKVDGAWFGRQVACTFPAVWYRMLMGASAASTVAAATVCCCAAAAAESMPSMQDVFVHARMHAGVTWTLCSS